MSSRVKLPKANPQAELDAEACRAFELAAEGRNNATPQELSEPKELYFPTKIRGLYTCPTIKSFPHHIEIAVQQPGATKHRIEWSSSWDETRKARHDRITLPTLKDAADTSVNCHGKPGARIPGIFVASEEVEKPLLVVWTLEGGTRTGIMIEPVGEDGHWERGEAEQDGFVMVQMR
ncbi:hypothetical protein J4E93_001055 [Alternaria ventricosa]|uniref:uncharacterized protein n=1 Tax=Alternaria ventricosa TaxID=1187951 RepID=UPI0020C29255|nr:uncharacterized protein J4E93_001055 [Alternaria ventricosa]KAI4653293.1 hypothetical protein J4E93_001055 [Alternaria ventricosa]